MQSVVSGFLPDHSIEPVARPYRPDDNVMTRPPVPPVVRRTGTTSPRLDAVATAVGEEPTTDVTTQTAGAGRESGSTASHDT
jgi:hypothetical protein